MKIFFQFLFEIKGFIGNSTNGLFTFLSVLGTVTA